MERREVLLNCLGGASLALAGWPSSATGLDDVVRNSPKSADLMEQAWDACYTGWSRSDYGYPFPYLDRAWAELSPRAGSSVRALIIETREKFRELVRDAEYSLPQHQSAVEREPSNWEPRYWLASTLNRAGRYEEALNHFLAASRTPGCTNDCLNDIGWCYYRKRMYEEARGCFEGAKIRDEDVSAWPSSGRMLTLENRMLVYGHLGLREQAAEAAKEYVRHYGRICLPERRALAKLGIDADEIYLRKFFR